MKGATQNNFTEMFDQAIESFDMALKTGVKMQEEATRWWSDLMGDTNSIQGMQERMRGMMMDALPKAQRNIDQYMKMIDKSYQSSMELLKKAFETTQSGSIIEAQNKAQELWESTLAALRTNAQAMVQINARAMESWAEFVHKDMAEEGAEAMSAAAKAAHATAAHATQAAHAASQDAQEAHAASAKRSAR